MPSQMGTCPLCNERRPLTDEHVVPRWMLRDWGAKPIWIGTSIGYMREMVVPVCQACNAWMNKRFETRTMPLLRSIADRTERVITPREQLRLTLWFTKTIMMYDLAAAPDLNLPHPSYSEFRRTGKPIPRSRLWIGHCGDAWPTEQLVDPPRNYLLPYGSFTRVMRFGPLLLFFLWVWGARAGNPPSIHHRWFSTHLRPIHPSQGDMAWPGHWPISSQMEDALRLLYRVEGMRSHYTVVTWRKTDSQAEEPER